jgi:glycosyltransferase involved in cell wall biosynthesis
MSATPRKVLHVMNGAAGGAALSTLGLIGALRERGVESCVFCHDIGSPAEKDAIRDAVGGAAQFARLYWWNKKLRSPLWKRPLQALRQGVLTGGGLGSTAQVAAFARRERVELVHTNTILTPEGSYTAALLGLPHVWHVRELVGAGKPYQFHRHGAALGAHLARWASFLVANSEETAACLRAARVPADALRVVPNGIDLARFDGARRARAADAPLVFGMVANLTTRWKKHALLIDAGARAQAKNVVYRFYGHGDVSDAYVRDLHERAAASGARIEFAGHVADPADIMRDLDLLVHTADHESFGRVIVEAMAASLPVIGVRGGGVGEIVVDGSTGRLAPPDDSVALAACIDRAAADTELRARLGTAGRKRAHECYSLAACADGIAAIYRLAAERPLGWRRPTLRAA